MVYMSDVSHIPQEAWRTIELLTPTLDKNKESDGSTASTSEANGTLQSKRYKLLVIDCLKLEAHTSHFGLQVSPQL
jgi:hypothetical protein